MLNVQWINFFLNMRKRAKSAVNSFVPPKCAKHAGNSFFFLLNVLNVRRIFFLCS